MCKQNFFLSIILSLFMASQPLQAQTTTMFNDEVFSMGVGIGVQYSFVGIQGKYFFSDYAGAIASGTYSIAGFVWQIGAELRIPETMPRRVSPYINLQVGSNSFVDLDAFVITGIGTSSTFEFVEENKTFIGITLGTGVKWDVFDNNKNYLTLGFDVRFINKNQTQFVDEFNATYATNFSTSPRRDLCPLLVIYFV